ncbi:MAG: transcription elongation factor GreA [Proteobacteria bacterium]|nr:transcription elongation factor GreA [Pseudomonadota bacterium]MCH8323237.1 transcription elongation factor GreA [Pseudomonadota bacterium]
MAQDKSPMLQGGYDALKDELRHLKVEERPEIIAAIEEARGHGDLSENAEYHAAKERQGQIESRIAELDDVLSRAEVIDPARLSGDTVTFGATVTMLDQDNKKKIYQIVGNYEVDVKGGKISFSSPLGAALIGKKKGDDVEVHTPSGEKYYEVRKVEFK